MGFLLIKGLTETTIFSFKASFIPSHSRIGDILVTGLDGPRMTTSAFSIALRHSLVADGFILKVLTTSFIETFPLCLTQYS